MVVQENRSASGCRAAIEALPHLAEKICSLWSSRDLDTFVQTILLDSREGQRQGLPVDVAKEMVFVAQINTLVRAMDAAPLLQMDVDAATEIIVSGDRAALGFPAASADPWADREMHSTLVRRRPTELPATSRVRSSRRPAQAAEAAKSPAAMRQPKAAPVHPLIQAGGSTGRYVSLFLNELPPLPSTVRVDLTTQETARAAMFPQDAQAAMSQEFYCCLAREVGKLDVEELMLSHLGAADQCVWVADAVRFARQVARLPQVSLRVDPLTACEAQVADALAAGLDCLIVDFNLYCKRWRSRAQERLEQAPSHFSVWLGHLLQKRDEFAKRTQRRCVIKLVQTGKTLPHHPLTPEIARLAEMADSFGVEWLPDVHDLLEGNQGGCDAGRLCWGPFVEANVRANGHLVVCCHDLLGATFVADLKEVEFAVAWTSDTFRTTRRELLAGNFKGGLCTACPRVAD